MIKYVIKVFLEGRFSCREIEKTTKGHYKVPQVIFPREIHCAIVIIEILINVSVSLVYQLIIYLF